MIFTAAVDLVIFGKDLFLAVSFNLRDPIGSLRATSDKSTDWYKDKMNQKDATDTESNYYDNPNPFVDFTMSGELLVLSKERLGSVYFIYPETGFFLVTRVTWLKIRHACW